MGKHSREIEIIRQAEREGTISRALVKGCSLCGSFKRLQFHHIDPDTKIFEIHQYTLAMPLETLILEIEKCSVLCPSCHRKMHGGCGRKQMTASFVRDTFEKALKRRQTDKNSLDVHNPTF